MASAVTPSHHGLAGRYGKGPFGAPVNDTLAELLSVVFSEEEAHLLSIFPLLPSTAEKAARRAGVDRAHAERLLEAMDRRGVVFSHRPKAGPKKYAMLPIIPGIFELTMCRGKKDAKSRKFARLFESYYDRSYFPERLPERAIKIIPVEEHIPERTAVLTTDRVSELIESHTSFAMAVCSCRHSREIVGEGCGKPKDVCMVLGPLAEFTIERGLTRRAEKAEMLDAVRRAEEAGLVHLADNLARANFLCSCCACCCGGLRLLSEFNLPQVIAASHFVARVDRDRCLHCGKCARRCPTGALSLYGKRLLYKDWKCIGCGVCVSACDKRHALSLAARPAYEPPHESLSALVADTGLGMLGLKRAIEGRFPGVYQKLKTRVGRRLQASLD